MKKYLNSQKYTNLLRIVGRSPKPLSRYAIMKEMDGDSYVYEMIKNLCPSHHPQIVLRKLCVIEDLADVDNNKDFKFKTIRQLDRDLRLDLKIGNPEDQDYGSTVKIRIVKRTNGSLLTIQYLSNPPISIRLKSNKDEFIRNSSLCVLKEIEGSWEVGRQFDARILKNSSGKHILYYCLKRNSAIATTDYLDVISGNQSEESVDFNDISQGTDEENDENLLYRLNFRGFLLYLYNISILGTKKSIARKWTYEVLSNPRILDLAPFLKYWDDFTEAGFNVLRTLEEIAVELQNHHEDNTTGLSSNNQIYLVRRATEIYFIRITNFFFLSIDTAGGFSHFYIQQRGISKLQEIERKANEYRLFILELLKDEYIRDLTTINELIEMYDDNTCG